MTLESQQHLAPQNIYPGGLYLAAPIMQASLSGYSDRAMRLLARRFGAPLTFAGVMLDKVLAHPRARRKAAAEISDDDHPIGGQLMGYDPETMALAAKGLEELGFDLVDLNFACPAPKVLRRDRGGGLMNNPKLVRDIFRRVRDVVSRPLWIKLRIGWDHDEWSRERFETICDQAIADGVDALVVHGRSVVQRYRGKADWEPLRRLKQRYPSATIFGSGDIKTAQDVVTRMNENNLDGVAIARGAIGNPWIFAEARALLANQPLPAPPSLAEQAAIMHEHFDMLCELYPEKKAVGYFRKFSIRYVKRHPQRKLAQMDLMAAMSRERVHHAIDKWYGL
ncbi:MAG: tRNA-dihydrouridine synthase [Sedimentisphaerales bacterium]|nr:tRNA-dihydrouridine synthase [Sedimentisphaerales bacterium]